MPARDVGSRAEIDAARARSSAERCRRSDSKHFSAPSTRAAAARAMLRLPPGFYRAGSLQLPPFAAIAGVAGATRIVMSGGPSMMSATGSDHVGISGLVLDGAGIPLPERRGLVAFGARPLRAHRRLRDCQCRPQRHRARGHRRRRHGEHRSTPADAAIFSSTRAGCASPAIPCAAPAMAASWSGAASPAMTARSSSTTASKTS